MLSIASTDNSGLLILTFPIICVYSSWHLRQNDLTNFYTLNSSYKRRVIVFRNSYFYALTCFKKDDLLNLALHKHLVSHLISIGLLCYLRQFNEKFAIMHYIKHTSYSTKLSSSSEDKKKKSHYESEEEHVISFLVVRSGILHVEPYWLDWNGRVWKIDP